MQSGFVVKKGTAVLVLNRKLGAMEELFTRAKDFVPERSGGAVTNRIPQGRGENIDRPYVVSSYCSCGALVALSGDLRRVLRGSSYRFRKRHEDFRGEVVLLACE